MGCMTCIKCAASTNESKCPECGGDCTFDEADEYEIEFDPDDIEDAIEEWEN